MVTIDSCCRCFVINGLIVVFFLIIHVKQLYACVRLQRKILRDSCCLHLQVEHNLDGDISHAVPDFSIDGKLSSLHLSVDPVQYRLIRGLLEHNFGEPLEEFQSQLLPHFKDPRPQVVCFIIVWSFFSVENVVY